MVIKSRGRFGVSRELEGSDPGRGEIRGWTPKSAKSILDFGSRPGSGRVMSGSRSGRGRVEVESRVRAGNPGKVWSAPFGAVVLLKMFVLGASGGEEGARASDQS